MRSLGRKQCGGLFLLGDELINMTALHSLLAVSVSEMLPVNIGVLFSVDAKRLARASSLNTALGGPPSYESLMNSPWKVRSSLFKPQAFESIQISDAVSLACAAQCICTLVWSPLPGLNATSSGTMPASHTDGFFVGTRQWVYHCLLQKFGCRKLSTVRPFA